MLRDRDLRAVLAAAEALAAVDDPADFADAALGAAGSLVDSDLVIYNDMDLHHKRSILVGEPVEAVDLAFNPVWEQCMHQHPVLAHAQRTLDPEARAISGLVTRRTFHRLELYQEVYRPMGIEDQLGFLLRVRPRRAIGLSLSRLGGTFTDEERAAFDLLRPHVVAAFRRVQARARLRERLATLELGAGAVRVGLLDLDTDGRLRYASTAASGLLIRHFGEATPLPWRVVAWWRRGAVEPLAFQSSDCRLVLHRSDDGVTVLIEEERLPPAVARFGLTPRETEILLRAARHASNDEIAHELGLSSRTVAKHLQNAYAKMAVSGRREAASRLGIRG